jgi:hypothetical protein
VPFFCSFALCPRVGVRPFLGPRGTREAKTMAAALTPTPAELEDFLENTAVFSSTLQALPTLDYSSFVQIQLPDPPLEIEGGNFNDDVAFVIRSAIPQKHCDAFISTLEKFDHLFRQALLSEDLPKGGYPDRTERKSDMLRFEDPVLAQGFWSRIEPLLKLHGGHVRYENEGNNNNHKEEEKLKWEACGVNDSLRILRYTQGEYFKPHLDGARVIVDENRSQRSFLSVLIYLNSAKGNAEEKSVSEDISCSSGHKSHQDNTSSAEGGDYYASCDHKEGEEGEDANGDSHQMLLKKDDFTGGSTVFHPMRSNGTPVKVNPMAGDMLIFDHNLYHEGEEILSGMKVAIRTDVIFTPSL